MPSNDYNLNPFFMPPDSVEEPKRAAPSKTQSPMFAPPPAAPIVERAEDVVSSYLRPIANVERHPVEYYQNVPYSDVFRSLQKSAPESAKGVIRKTVEGIGDIPSALTGLGSIAESGVYNIPYLGSALAGSKEELERKQAPLRQVPSAVQSALGEAGKYIREGYGSEAAIKKTLAEDPFKIPSDIASAATLYGGGLKGAAKLLPQQMGENLSKIGSGITKFGELTSPITAPYKAAEYAVGTVAPELVKHYLHGTSGISKESLDEFMKAGLKNDPTVANVMAGKITPEMTVQSVSDAIAKKKAQRETAYISGMNQAQQNTIMNTPIPYTDIHDSIAKAYKDYTSGPLQFGKNKDALNAIKKADSLVKQWDQASQTHPYYSTAKGIDDLKQAIDGIIDEHESGAAKKALGSIRNSAKNSIAKLDKGYADTLDHYSQESTSIGRLASGLQRGDPNINVGGNIRNLIRASKDEFRKGLIEDLLDHDPTLLSQIAAHELHGAPPFSWQRALGTGIVTGLAATAMPQIPMMAYLGGLGAASLPFTSPSAAAFTAKKIGQAKRMARPIAKAIPPTFSVGYLTGEDQSQAPMLREGVLDKSNFFAPPGQAYGGRAPRATGGRIGMTAERLLSMLEGAKRSVQKDTEALLQEPDEKIAKALTIAKEGI